MDTKDTGEPVERKPRERKVDVMHAAEVIGLDAFDKAVVVKLYRHADERTLVQWRREFKGKIS